MKIAALFPGQGSQYVGMGKDFYDNFPYAKELFELAEDILKVPLKKICFEGSEEELRKTENTQPAILLMSYICFRLLENEGIKIDSYAGFSLGEYSALTSCNVFDFSTSLDLVKKRGIIIDNAVPSGTGGMGAILGLDDEVVENICKKIDGIVVPVNYNCPGQLVISGEKQAVEKACDLADEMGAKKTVILNVSGPFHSPLLKDASEEFNKILKNIKIHPINNNKVVSNVTANYHTDDKLIELLTRHIYSPVQWKKSIDYLINEKVDTFIEFGPGRVLSGFLRSIDKTKTALFVNNIDSFKKTLETLKK